MLTFFDNIGMTCHSGGCPGSDMEWENEGDKYGVKTIAYSFYNHKQEGKNRQILTVDELKEGYQAAQIANKTLKRNFEYTYQYVKNLISRNWFQVKNSEAVFAIGKFLTPTIVAGGTGWACQMAIDNKKPLYFFDQVGNVWTKFNYERNVFEPLDYIPELTKNFAGIGTREINENGKRAIKDIFKHNLNHHE